MALEPIQPIEKAGMIEPKEIARALANITLIFF
jgi:hypothetical protein